MREGETVANTADAPPLFPWVLSWLATIAGSLSMPSDRRALHGSSGDPRRMRHCCPHNVPLINMPFIGFAASLSSHPLSFLESLPKLTTCVKVGASVFGFDETQVRRDLTWPSPHSMPSTMLGTVLSLSSSTFSAFFWGWVFLYPFYRNKLESQLTQNN